MPKVDENTGLVKLGKEERDKLARRVCNIVETGLQETANLRERWDKNQQFYTNDPSAVSPLGKDMVMFPFPLIQPRVDALNDHVIGTITSNAPFMLSKKRGTIDRIKGAEDVLQFHAQLGGLKNVLKTLGPIIGNTNCGIMRAWFDVAATDFRPTDYVQGMTTDDAVQFAGFRFDPIHPADFICYPHFSSIETCTACGHRFSIRHRDIEELQEAGRYYKDVDPMERTNEIENSAQDPVYKAVKRVHTGDSQDDEAEFWQVIIKAKLPGDKAERYYLATVERGVNKLFELRPYDFPRPWYFDFRYQPRAYGSFFPSNSIATNMQGLQNLYTYLNNLLIYGTIYNAMPAGYSDGLAEKSVALEWNKIVSIPGTVNMVQTNFAPQAVAQIIMMVEAVADSTCRITKAGLASGGSTKTATEQMAQDAGMESGIKGYIDTIGVTLEYLYDYMAHVLYHTWDIWYPIYQYCLPGVEREVLEGPLEWEGYNKTPSTSPAQTVQKMQLVLQLAQADQTEVLSQVMQAAGAMFQQVGLPPEAFAALQSQVQAIQSQHMNPKAVVRTILSELGIQNKEEILNELGASVQNDMASLPGIPAMEAPIGGGAGLQEPPIEQYPE